MVAVCEEELTMIAFQSPVFLLLLVPLVIALGWSFRLVGGMAKPRKFFAFVVRGILAGLLIVALAEPEARRPDQGVATLFVLDQSDSISGAETKRAKDFMAEAVKRMSSDDQAGLIVFGQEAMIEVAPSSSPSLARIDSKLERGASDLAAALRLGSAAFPDGKSKRIVLLTDGNETSGDALSVGRTLALDGISLDTVSLGASPNQSEVVLQRLEVPPRADENQPISLRAVIDATQATRGVLDLERDGVVISSTRIDIPEGTSSVLLSDRVKGRGFARYRAVLRPDRDTDIRNNLGVGFVSIQSAPTILLVQKATDPSLARALTENGLNLERVSPEAFPARAEQLQRFSAVLFNDVPAENFSANQMKIIQSAVRDTGMGFAMIGGEGSFLPGGYFGTPIAETLPVDLNIRQRKTFPSTSILIVVDCSGSMSVMEDGYPKIRLAAMAAEESVKLLSPTDRIAVMGSTDGLEMVVPFTDLKNRGQVIEGIRRLAVSGGGIFIGPSLEKADRLIRAEESKVRHVIVLADGNDSTDWRDAIERATGLRNDKVTVSVVAIGDGKDVPMLRSLASVGGGRFYLANRAGQLPAIFTQDTAVIARRAIEEGEFFPKLTGNDPAIRGISATPSLLAYNLTDSRPLARVSMRTHKDDPLYASWQYGLGRSAAFTSDSQARWAQNWVGWEGYRAFWSQVVRSISRQQRDSSYSVEAKAVAGKSQIEVRSLSGGPLPSGARVVVSDPTGKQTEVSLTQVGPDSYQGYFESQESGTYFLTLAAGTQALETSGYSVSYQPEYRNLRTNEPLLSQLSQVGLGKELDRPGGAFRPVPNSRGSVQDLWFFFILLAALLLPFDVGIRRLAIPLWRILGDAMKRRRGMIEVERQERQQVTARLQEAKSRAAQKTSPKGELPVIDLGTAPLEPQKPSSQPKPSLSADATANTLMELKRKKKQEEDGKG
jgi:uncharacterized membrane protein